MTVERNAAYSLLQDQYLDKYSTDEEASTERKTDRRSVIKEMIGEGYNFEGTFSTFRRHKALAIAQIKRIAGPKDISKQRQLAQSLLDHYTGGGANDVQPNTIDYTAHAAVIEGVVETLRKLKARNLGRYTREDRITQQVLLSVAVSKTQSKKVLASIRHLLHTSVKSVEKAIARNEAASKEERPYFFVDDETSCNAYDPVWAEFVTECWDGLTRRIYDVDR